MRNFASSERHNPIRPSKPQQSHQVQHPLKSAHQIPAMNNHPPLLSPLRDHQPHASSKNLNKTPFSFPTYCNSSINSSLCTQPTIKNIKKKSEVYHDLEQQGHIFAVKNNKNQK